MLSQWRAYGDSGQGISIGFLGDAIAQMSGNEQFKFGKCVYDIQLQYNICESAVNQMFKVYSLKDVFGVKMNNFCDDLNRLIYSIGIFLKHPSFRDEREWRIVTKHTDIYADKWKYRASRGGISPYIEIDIAGLIKKKTTSSERAPFVFTLGPKARKSPTASALQALTYYLTGTSFGVNKSGIPMAD